VGYGVHLLATTGAGQVPLDDRLVLRSPNRTSNEPKRLQPASYRWNPSFNDLPITKMRMCLGRGCYEDAVTLAMEYVRYTKK